MFHTGEAFLHAYQSNGFIDQSFNGTLIMGLSRRASTKGPLDR